MLGLSDGFACREAVMNDRRLMRERSLQNSAICLLKLIRCNVVLSLLCVPLMCISEPSQTSSQACYENPTHARPNDQYVLQALRGGAGNLSHATRKKRWYFVNLDED
ncbi:hypothetical protein NDU88_007157 [Pleurodeles waltl]|uniref:Uncharacterized protein n=1 Tax=Pleurodeles waltl TaxID=8319 RepID=A0AAV7PMY3_PLEWA|nr:hypothetical protein NDU88_007157 [Pleurodeles waltl]